MPRLSQYMKRRRPGFQPGNKSLNDERRPVFKPGNKSTTMKNNVTTDNQHIRLLDIREIDHFSFSGPERVVVIMPCTNIDRGMETARVLLQRAGAPCRIFVVHDSKRQGFIRTLNQAAEKVAAEFIGYLAQDAWPGRDWLKCACETMDRTGKGLLAFNDGKWNGRIAAFGMVRTAWVRQLYQGCIFFPGYVSHGADNELTVIARALDMFVYNPECTLVEVDPEKDTGGSNPRDRALFRERFSRGFDGVVPEGKKEKLGEMALEYKAHWQPVTGGQGVSIIILTWNRAQALAHLLEGFYNFNTYAPTEVIIVDHGSSDNTQAVVARFATKGIIRYIDRGKKASFSGSVRFARRRARFPWLLFLKNNVVYTADIIPRALAALKNDPATVAGVLLHTEFTNLKTGIKLPAAGWNTFQLIFCHQKTVDGFPKADKAFQLIDKHIHGRREPSESVTRPAAFFSGCFPDINAPDHVTLVLYTSGNLKRLRRCLISLRQYTDLEANTVFLIDDSQNVRVREKIDEWIRDFDFVERITCLQRKGLCVVLQEVVKKIKWGDCCVISDAVVLTPDWLIRLKKAAYRDQRIGLVTPVTNSHPHYTFRMNPGDTIITCAKKLHMVSARESVPLSQPDANIFYLKYDTIRKQPLPEFNHDAIEFCLSDYVATLSKMDRFCVLADDTFVYVHCAGESVKVGPETQPVKMPPQANQCNPLFFPAIEKLRTLHNYRASDIRLTPPRTVAVFFHGINLGGGALVLVELCNDLILKGWNVVAVLLNNQQKETAYFDLLFEPYPSDDADDIAGRLGPHSFLMATFWKTASRVRQTAAKNPTFTPFYFIQDFEVMFYDPRNNFADPDVLTYHEQASASYGFNFRQLTTSDWIAAKIRAFLDKPDHPIEKLRIGYNPELFYPSTEKSYPEKPVRIIAMARPRTPRRGFDDLVRILAKVYENNPACEIVLYGTDDLSTYRTGFPFHNLGVVRPDALRQHYSKAQIYVDASLFQGFGLTGLEAMACGCACVLSDSGGPSEYAKNGENALLVPPGDIHAHVKAIQQLIDDGDLRNTISDNALQAAQKFNIHHAADDFAIVAERLIASRKAEEKSRCQDPMCNIIVPIFNQISAVRNCLESIAAYTEHPHRVLLVDDGSDAHTADYLRKFADARENFTYLRNEKNLGFVGSVNAGMKATDSGDIVLLNSDTLVTSGWLGKLVRCAASDPDIGIISPLTTRSSHLWIKPNPGETIFETAKKIEQIAVPLYPDVVTPEGWCFYIRRQVYETLGGFDPVFGRGYCEESDYAMQAMANGWRTVCCDDTFIFHEGMVTFKGERGSRYRHNRKIFDHRWMSYYKQAYTGFLTRNPMGKLRRKHTALAPSSWRDPADITSNKPINILEMLPAVATDTDIQRCCEQLEGPLFRRRLWQKTGRELRRIVFLVQQMQPYGGILSVVQLANDLICLGMDVKVVVLTAKNYHEFPGLLTRPIFFKNHNALMAHFPAADAVVATLWTTVYYMAALFLNRSDFLPFYFVQDYEPDFYPKHEIRIRKQIEQTYHCTPYAFAKTPWICDKIRALGAEITEVPPALDLDLFYPRDKSEEKYPLKKILTLLRPHTPQRGFDTAVQVLKNLYGSRKDIEIHVFGCDDQELKKQKLQFPVINHGIVENGDLPELYSQAHVFVEFSNFHGFGRTIAEAMACGCACVITDSGGISLFAGHEKNALIAPPGDVNCLFKAINRVCDDKKLHQRLSENARNSVLKFDRIRSAKKTLTFLRQSFSGDAADG